MGKSAPGLQTGQAPFTMPVRGLYDWAIWCKARSITSGFSASTRRAVGVPAVRPCAGHRPGVHLEAVQGDPTQVEGVTPQLARAVVADVFREVLGRLPSERSDPFRPEATGFRPTAVYRARSMG